MKNLFLFFLFLPFISFATTITTSGGGKIECNQSVESIMKSIRENPAGFVCCVDSKGKPGCVRTSAIETVVALDPEKPDNNPIPGAVSSLAIAFGLILIALAIYFKRRQ